MEAREAVSSPHGVKFPCKSVIFVWGKIKPASGGVQLKQSTGSVLAQGPGATLSITRKIEEGHHRVGGTIEFCRKEKEGLGRWAGELSVNCASVRTTEKPGKVACARKIPGVHGPATPAESSSTKFRERRCLRNEEVESKEDACYHPPASTHTHTRHTPGAHTCIGQRHTQEKAISPLGSVAKTQQVCEHRKRAGVFFSFPRT